MPASGLSVLSDTKRTEQNGELGVNFPLENGAVITYGTVIRDSKVQTKYFSTAADEEEFTCQVIFKSEFRRVF